MSAKPTAEAVERGRTILRRQGMADAACRLAAMHRDSGADKPTVIDLIHDALEHHPAVDHGADVPAGEVVGP